jgi:hypothetical protein
MSKLMFVLGIMLAAVGLALAVMSISSPAQLQVYGITPEAAAILLVGGILSLGLGAVIAGLTDAGARDRMASAAVESMASPASVASADPAADKPESSPLVFPGRRTAAVAAVPATAAATSVTETIAALEQAKSDIKAALSGGEPTTETETAPEPEEELVEVEAEGEAEEEAAGDAALYVVEEQIIRGRPARILSDSTVEAETDEGWMRFENMEHLNEYLDSV